MSDLFMPVYSITSNTNEEVNIETIGDAKELIKIMMQAAKREQQKRNKVEYHNRISRKKYRGRGK